MDDMGDDVVWVMSTVEKNDFLHLSSLPKYTLMDVAKHKAQSALPSYGYSANT